MAARKRQTRLRPKTPSRVKKRTAKRKRARSHHHPELIGLALAALGIFLGTVSYAGWNGGYVGKGIADGIHYVIGAEVYAVPVVLCAIGALMLGRSALIDVRP